MSAGDDLVAELRRLELDHQYVEDVAAFDQDRIELVRPCGGAAARRLGWRVRTLPSTWTTVERALLVVGQLVQSEPVACSAGNATGCPVSGEA